MTKIWKLKSEIPKETSEKIAGNLSAASTAPSASLDLKKEGNGNRLLAQLLYNRGLTEKDKIQDFLEPKYENLHSPFLFQDMQKAVNRIWQAIENKEKIYIYGDYDADAITANAVLQQTFRYLGAEVSSYIPDRFSEGYGVNLEAMEKIKADGATVVITVDCGTNSRDAADFCLENKIDFIITDHHEIIGEVPKAYALINPKNTNDSYPYHEITGVGVAFKLACGLLSSGVGAVNGRPQSSETGGQWPPLQKQISSDWAKWLLDLVAIGTVADCHSLMGENRILVKYGLKVLQKTKWIGLRALMASAGLDLQSKPADTYTLGFVVAPRLNAAGRLEHANVALDLLLETDAVSAQQKAVALEQINSRRRQLTEQALSEAKEKVLLIKDRKILVVVGDGWPKGVVGLVAGRLAEEHYKPVIALEKTDGTCTGSARTAGDFDILEALKFASEHLLKFGGHKQAAGLSLESNKVDAFYQKLLEYAEKNFDESKAQKILNLEAELESEDLSLVTCGLLLNFEPFGVDNHRPKFLVSGMQISAIKLVGAASQHMQLQLQKAEKKVSAIAFNSGHLEKICKVGDTVDVACELTEDNWNGNSSVKLRVVDLRISGELT